MRNKEGIWMHGTHRRDTGAPPDTQIPIRLMIFLMCEENMQKLVKSAKIQNPMGMRYEMGVNRGEMRSVGGMRLAL